MRKEFLILFLVLTLSLGLFACGGSSEPAKDSNAGSKDAGTAKPAGDAGKTSSTSSSNANPWGSFKVGSYVTTKTTSSVEVMGKPTETVTETKMTLAELTPDKAILDVENTVMGHSMKTRTEIPLSAGAMPAASPGSSAPKMGTDTLTVAGKTLNCKTIEFDSEAAGNKVNSKSWMSDQVPGGLVKSVSTTTGATNSKVTVEVVEFQAS